MKPPLSAYQKTSGMYYFARMLSKIRLHAEGKLREDFHSHLGRGADRWCCDILGVAYPELKARALEGGTDEEILAWCHERGRRLGETDLLVWNAFASKLGWNDAASPLLEKLKAESGLRQRDDILTMFDYFEADEGRSA